MRGFRHNTLILLPAPLVGDRVSFFSITKAQGNIARSYRRAHAYCFTILKTADVKSEVVTALCKLSLLSPKWNQRKILTIGEN